MNITLSIFWLLVAYIIVTWIGILHTIINWKVFKIKTPKSIKQKSLGGVIAYKATEPFHPLYNIFIFPIFTNIYLTQTNSTNLYHEAIIVAFSWTLFSMVIDLFGWVIIKHPWSLTLKEMYIDYQPWISLVYLAIFISPFIAVFTMVYF